MNKKQSSHVVKLSLISFFLLSFNVPVYADQTVEIHGNKPSPQDPQLPSKNGDYGSTDTGTSGGMGSDQTAAAQKKQENSGDIRCTAIATDEMRNTTSRSDYNSREMVANQLIANANLRNGPASRILSTLYSYFNSKDNRYIFKVTYADGGWEWWGINPAIGSISVIPFSNGNMYPGDGVVKPNDDCSKKG